MTSHGIRGGSTLTSTLRNVENETGAVARGGKAGTSAMEMAKGRVTRTRAALGDKTNQAILPVASKNAKGMLVSWLVFKEINDNLNLILYYFNFEKNKIL